MSSTIDQDVELIREAVNESLEFEKKLLQDVEESIHPPVQLLVDKATPFQLAVTMQTQGECQGSITAEGSMIKSNLISSSDAVNLFLRGHTQEPFVYENARQPIYLAHPALPMVNLVQPTIASAFYCNENLNEVGVTARFVPFFHGGSL